MYSCMHGDIGQTVLVAATGGLAQSYLNYRTRPTIVQALFNSANLVVSVGISFASTAALATLGVNVATPSVNALLVSCYFAVNTTVVSGKCWHFFKARSSATCAEPGTTGRCHII